MILIPKVGVPADVYAVDMLVTQIEQAKKREKQIGFEVLIETALGMANVEAIAQSSKRLEAMSFGVADYAASTRARTTVIGGVNPDYAVLTDKDEAGNRDDPLAGPVAVRPGPHAGRLPRLRPAPDRRPVRRLLAIRTATRSAARRCAVLGYEGKWAIHPRQIDARQRGLHAVRGRGRPRPGASWKPWRRPPRPARAPSRSTAA